MELINLPEELVEEVAGYLSVKDVISCLQVNSHWENAFDKSRVWRKFCTFHPKYFSMQKSKLKSTSDIALKQGCEAKEAFVKEQIVKKNISNGNFHIQQINCGKLYCDSVLNVVDEVGKHWLFISCMEGFEDKHMLKVWNLGEDPVMHTSVYTPLGKVQRLFCSVMQMNRGKLFFINENIILVYKFTYPLYELKFMYQTVFEPLITFPNGTISNIKLTCVGNVVLGFLYTNLQLGRNAPSFIHVWNDEGSLIFKDYGNLPPHLFKNFTPSNSYPGVNLKTTSEYVAVALVSFDSQIDTRFFSVRIFNVRLLQYSKLCVHKSKQLFSYDICGHVLSLCTKSRNSAITIRCYNIDTGDSIFKFKLNSQRYCGISHELLAGCGEGELIILEHNHIFIFDLSTKRHTISFKIPGKEKNIRILQKGSLLLEATHKGVLKQEVWDYTIGRKKYEFNLASELRTEQTSHSYSFINNYSTTPKLIVFPDPMVTYPRENKNTNIFVISFW